MRKAFRVFFGVSILFAAALLIYSGVTLFHNAHRVEANLDRWDQYQQSETPDADPSLSADLSDSPSPDTRSGEDEKSLPKDMIGILVIEKTGERIPFLRGTGDDILAQGAGLFEGASLPGDDGATILFGHRDGVFQDLKGLLERDAVTVEMPSGTYRYTVSGVAIKDPEDLYLWDTASDMVLITCYPFSYVGTAPQRYIVNLQLRK